MAALKILSSFAALLLLFVSVPANATESPLYTDSRWIVNESGNRVKLACVNWGSHLQPMVAEGLDKQPLDVITGKIASMGFNCVRFTWPTYLMTNASMYNVTVRQSFERIGQTMNESIAGIEALNPSIIDIPLVEAFKTVLGSLKKHNVMIILDNHVSVPGWCCGLKDGNGFFGDAHFDPEVWRLGLSRMATLSKDFSNVIGMSLRNELRGARQNVSVWFREMQRGAEAIHAANPKVLVIFSGFDYDKNLSFLHDRMVSLSFKRKLVFEVHHYGFTDQKDWENNNPNDQCSKIIQEMKNQTLFLIQKGYPLFMSEFGANQNGSNVNDNRYFNCYLALLAELDMDFALWTLYGSYYFREGIVGINEVYGALTWNWGDIRNQTYLSRVQAIQKPFRGPGFPKFSYKMLFHPLTGLCVMSVGDSMVLATCNKTDAWHYKNQKLFAVNKYNKCVQAIGEGKEAKLGRFCLWGGSIWDRISDTKMHLATKAGSGKTLCLDVDSNNAIVTNSCKCLSGDSSCDPATQWFKLVDSQRVLNH